MCCMACGNELAALSQPSNRLLHRLPPKRAHRRHSHQVLHVCFDSPVSRAASVRLGPCARGGLFRPNSWRFVRELCVGDCIFVCVTQCPPPLCMFFAYVCILVLALFFAKSHDSIQAARQISMAKALAATSSAMCSPHLHVSVLYPSILRKPLLLINIHLRPGAPPELRICKQLRRRQESSELRCAHMSNLSFNFVA